MAENLTLGLAFFAGLASFLSPCCFALVPAYVGYLSGRTAATGGQPGSSSLLTVSHGLAFVLGFSAVFVVLGALAAALGGLLYGLTDILVKVGGVVVFIFGLHLTGILRIPWLEYDLRPHSTPDRNRGYLSSALMGVFFSAGWSPCVGPVLGAILTLSFNGGSILEGTKLLSAYSAGLGLPFLLAATQIGWVTTILRKYGKVMRYTEIAMGVVLLILGVLLFQGQFQRLATLGFFFSTFDEAVVGRLLLAALALAVVMGLGPASLARARGKNFWDWWFLSAGASLVVLVALYMLGVLNPLVRILFG